MLESILKYAKLQLREGEIASWALDAELLLCKVIEKPREYLLRGEGELTAQQKQAFDAMIARRLLREPMAHLLGMREFWGREFSVTKDTLDPRPDSETLIEAVLQQFPNKNECLNVLDMGTGTGCLLLTILAEYPGALGVGVDISPAALSVAKQNGEQLEVSSRVQWQCMDAANVADDSAFKAAFDLVITNPPYIPSADILTLEPEVASYEPKSALDGGLDGFDCYQGFAPAIAAALKQGGVAVIEAGVGQAEKIAAIMQAQGLLHKITHNDLSGIARAVVVKKYKPPASSADGFIC